MNLTGLVFRIVTITALLMAVNLWATKLPLRLDLTNNRVYTLTDETRAVLMSLSKPVSVRFFYDQRSRGMQDARFLLEQYAEIQPLLTVHAHDPQLEPAIAEQHNVQFAGTTILRSGERELRINQATEVAFTNALIQISSEAVGEVCFTDGHIESNPFSLQSHDHFEHADSDHDHGSGGRPLTLHERHGLGKARNALEALGYTVSQRLLFQGDTPLAACTLLVVASPQAAFSELEVKRLGAALEDGLPMLLLLEPGIDDNLNQLLHRFGINKVSRRVHDPKLHYWTDPATPAVSNYPRHRATRRLALSFFPGAASFEPLGTAAPRNLVVVPLVESSAASVLEGSDNTARSRTLAMLAYKRDRSVRMALVGDGDFATNSFFGILGNGQLFLNLVAELTGFEHSIDIQPREYAVAKLSLSNRAFQTIFAVTTIVLPLMALCLGGFVLWRQRRAG